MPNMEDLKRRIVRIVANCNRPKVSTCSSLLKISVAGRWVRAQLDEVTAGACISDPCEESYSRVGNKSVCFCFCDISVGL